MNSGDQRLNEVVERLIYTEKNETFSNVVQRTKTNIKLSIPLNHLEPSFIQTTINWMQTFLKTV